MTNRKGIILAGGSGTRLYPITVAVSKQLLPIYDKPMIYYPLSVLMLAGIREIAIITTPQDADQFRRALGDGVAMGPEVYLSSSSPRPTVWRRPIFWPKTSLPARPRPWCWATTSSTATACRNCLPRQMRRATGGTVFGYQVADPERYGVVAFDRTARSCSIVEKPEVPPSNFAVTGLYFLDGTRPGPGAQGETLGAGRA